ncbi:MAG TPA: 2-C-methyl-D-erythritol 4-phosphate cytidylyltransferase [Vicinamibacterales bacterium]|nr:2-C-methyl-D-erythritol 4-phosphate cytidylyltransferase [Vicinamibacterales bacterium]
MRVTAIIAAAGAGRRLGAHVPKQLLDLGGRSILARAVAAFDRHPDVTDLVIVLPGDLVADGAALIGATSRPRRFVAGGATRQESVANAVETLDETTDVVLVHDAARPFVSAEVIARTIAAAAAHGAAIPAIEARDTVKRTTGAADARIVAETVAREQVVFAQTPQGFRRAILAKAVALGQSGVEGTDEASLAERAGCAVHLVQGDPANVKITTEDDLAEARRRVEAERAGRVGTGYDLHRLVEGRPLILGGVTIPSERGAMGHSDADVVCHAATDAILGAAGLGDIGRHFPDTDPAWKGASSLALLAEAAKMVRERHTIENVDVTVVLERPKIGAHLAAMRAGVAGALGIDPARVSIKGKTNEGLDAVGRGEAIAAHAVAMLGEKS